MKAAAGMEMVRRGAMEVRAGLRPVQRRSDGGPRGPVEIEFRHEKQGMAKAGVHAGGLRVSEGIGIT
jgi:hypothetical protein